MQIQIRRRAHRAGASDSCVGVRSERTRTCMASPQPPELFVATRRCRGWSTLAPDFGLRAPERACIGSDSRRWRVADHACGHASAVGVAHWLRARIVGVPLEGCAARTPPKKKEEVAEVSCTSSHCMNSQRCSQVPTHDRNPTDLLVNGQALGLPPACVLTAHHVLLGDATHAVCKFYLTKRVDHAFDSVQSLRRL